MIDSGAAEARNAQNGRVSTRAIARAISWIGHPLVFVSVSVGIVVFYRLANRVGTSVLIALFLAVVLSLGKVFQRSRSSIFGTTTIGGVSFAFPSIAFCVVLLKKAES